MTTDGPTARGGTDERDLITIHAVAPIDAADRPELADRLLETRTQLGSQTGYMMRFGDPDDRALTVFDVLSLPGTSYPVSTAALKSLPAFVRAELERAGAVQVFADYDPDDGFFGDVTMKWEDRTPIQRIAELLGAGHSLHEALDYVVTQEEAAYSVSQWADIRGVETADAISQHIRSVRRHLDRDE
jgi:hypothetical protein